MEYHPDRNNGDHSAELKFKEINEAYEILKDPQKRAAYDRFGHQAFEHGGGGGFGAGAASGFASFADIFDEFFGDFRGGGRRSGRERGSDLRYNLEVTLEEAYCRQGGRDRGADERHLRRLRRLRRQARHAAESLPDLRRRRPRQGEPGRLLPYRAHLPRLSRPRRGRVRPLREMLRRRPRQPRRARSPSTSPPASRTARASGLPAKARPGLRGGPAGDLYIFLSIKPHAFFQRDGADIFCRVPVSMTTAALGGQFEVPTLDGGRSRVKVPEGTQSGKQIHLKGKGMPVLRSHQVGDMYVQILVETPRKLSRRQRELLEEFERDFERGEQSGIERVLFAREGLLRHAR